MSATYAPKVCALIAALQYEPTDVERLAVLSGMDDQAVRKWLAHFEQFKLAAKAGEAPRPQGKSGPAPVLWAWRFA